MALLKNKLDKIVGTWHLAKIII